MFEQRGGGNTKSQSRPRKTWQAGVEGGRNEAGWKKS